jgi:hypothetical protein
MAKRIETVIVVALAAAAGFGTGYELQQPPTATGPAAPSVPMASAAAAQAAPALAQATPERLTRTRSPTAESTPAIAPAASTQPTPAAEQAFEEIALMISEQISTGQRTPEHQMAIAAGAAQLSLAQRRTLMEQYVGALNRGELSPSEPPPL